MNQTPPRRAYSEDLVGGAGSFGVNLMRWDELMKILSEKQAQELSNLSGCKIYTCADGAVKIKGRYNVDVLPIKIDAPNGKTWIPIINDSIV